MRYLPLLRRLPLLAAAGALALLAACSTVERGQAVPLERGASWVVLPFANQTDTPLAGQRAEAVAQALLIGQQVGAVRNAPRLARIAEAAKFDAVFLVDSSGVRSTHLPSLARTARSDFFEPLTLLSALSQGAQTLGRAVGAGPGAGDPDPGAHPSKVARSTS